ncbi:hypothetical protein AXY19_RS13305 [Acinetobacter baumannii]|nr:hypothetical protein [Acinetobacter baumannii]
MPNQNTKSFPKNYNAGDLTDAYELSELDLSWSLTAINTLSEKITQLKNNLKESYQIHDCYFSELETLAGMFEYLVSERLEFHAKEAKHYLEEWEQLKEGNK